MVESSFRALLVPPVGATSLAEPCVPPTRQTTIALAAIAVPAYEEVLEAFLMPAYP
jgi:hypothetical protein